MEHAVSSETMEKLVRFMEQHTHKEFERRSWQMETLIATPKYGCVEKCAKMLAEKLDGKVTLVNLQKPGLLTNPL